MTVPRVTGEDLQAQEPVLHLLMLSPREVQNLLAGTALSNVDDQHWAYVAHIGTYE